MKIRFKTGEMAALHGISKQTLIYYDSIGLFRPREVGEETGYRYYTLDQCEKLDVILCLKSLGMGLKEIKGYLGEASTEERIRMLESQRRLVQLKILEIGKTKKRLESIIGTLRNRMLMYAEGRGVKHVAERRVIVEDVASPYDEYALGMAFKKLIGMVRDRFDTNYLEVLVFLENAGGVERFKKAAMQVRSDFHERIPAGEYAYIYHKGPYQALREAHDALKDYLEASGYKAAGDAIETVLLDAFAVASETDYLVEIQIPVVKR